MAQADEFRKPVSLLGGGQKTQLDELLLRIVDGGLAGCIFVVPLLMGGRQALGQLALVSLAVAVALSWSLYRSLQDSAHWRFSTAMLLPLAGVILLVLQTAPLGESVLARLSPRTAELLPLWTTSGDAPGSLGAWSTVSLTPAATKAGLTLLLAYTLLFLVTVQRIRRIDDVERLLRWIALSTLLMAAFGLLQLLASNGKFFWFYEHPFSTTSDGAKGSFHVRNHFAHFLALGIGPMIWWLQHREPERGGRRSRAIRRRAGLLPSQTQASSLRSIALGVVLFAGLLSLSRGGMLVIFLAAAVSVAVCYRAKRLGTGFVLSLGSIAVLIGALLTIDGYDRVSGRLGELSAGSMETVDAGAGRRTIWGTVAKAIPDYALLGAGVGSHAEVYPVYFERPQESEFTHAESGPLQVLLETGAIGLTLLLAGIGYCGIWCIGSLFNAGSARTKVCVGAVLASLCVSVVHSTVDFVWYVPACTAIVALLAACACRMFQLAAAEAGREVQPIALPRFVAVALAAAVAVLGTWMIGNRVGPTLAEPHWDRYRIMAMAAEMPAPSEDEEAELAPSPEEATEASQEEVGRMISELEQVVRWDPQNGRAHLRLAVSYINQFNFAQQASENAMALAQIRDAAIQASLTGSDQDVDRWITGLLGERRDYLDQALEHVRQGLTLCPLQGEGYLYLAELSFLEGAGAAAKSAYIDQALRVRSFDGAVLFEAGREAWLAGNYPQGIQYWQKSFRSGRTHQRQLIDMLAGRIPVSSFMEVFEPDVHALRILHARYRELDQPDELDRLRRDYASAAAAKARGLQGKEAAKYWLEARWLYALTGQSDYALQCAENAYRLDRNDYDVRHALAQCLVKLQRFDEAEEHLNWCLQRRPRDERLQLAAREAFKGRIDREAQSNYRDSVNYSDPTNRLLR